ncbi:MAG: hypothetical protein IJI33_07540 [Solobacterium sp.]|nr:hypothetical protein [Solobacterium sp.]
MTKYSRTAKYEDLRSRLQNDAEEDIRSRELSQYERRLNQISANNFEAPKEYNPADHDPIHARRKQYQEPAPAPLAEPVRPAIEDSSDNIGFNPSSMRNENYTSAFNNEYLNEYIKEVKQYNIDQGTASSTNTDLDILRSLRGDRPAPSKPYPDEPTIEVPYSRPVTGRPAPAPAPTPAPAPAPARRQEESTATMDIPFFRSDPDEDFIRDDRQNGTKTMTREDIAAEVQSLLREQEQPQPQPAPVYENRPAATRVEDSRSAHQQLLNETTQMRAQLDDYEDNLTEVSDKMQRTNQVLNIVLIVLIVVLIAVLGLVIYWILLSKGIL